jgi:C4-type Zn-finger protein
MAYKPDSKTTSKVDCPICKDGTKIIITETSYCTAPVGMRIRGPGGRNQWRQKTIFSCPDCGSTFKKLPKVKSRFAKLFKKSSS